jgi:XTP/dITP diphosphohydrolase
VLDGIALAQPALSLAAKILQRAERGGIAVPLPLPDAGPDAQALGTTLLGLVAQARDQGLDAEAALRAVVLEYAEAIRRAENGNPRAK